MRIAGERGRQLNAAASAPSRCFNPFTQRASSAPCRRRPVEEVRGRAFAIAHAFKPQLTPLRALPNILQRRRPRIVRAADGLDDRRPDQRRERGLCLKDATYEAGRVADVLVFGAGEVLKDDGQIFSCDLTPHGKKRRVYTQRDPLLGVISAITPFNHPMNQVAHKIVPSIATNNRMVLKPSRRCRSRRICFASLLYEAGLPGPDAERSSPAIRARSRTRCSPTRTSTSSPSPAASPSARRSPPGRATGASSSSSAATTRSSSWTTPTSTRRRRSPCKARTRTRASAAPRSMARMLVHRSRSPTRFTEGCVVEKTRDVAASATPPRPEASRWARSSTTKAAAPCSFEAPRRRLPRSPHVARRLLRRQPARRRALRRRPCSTRVPPEMTTLVREEDLRPGRRRSPPPPSGASTRRSRSPTAPPTGCRRRSARSASTT